ncbi:MAG: hypothetical protein ACJ8F7_13205 [Gemmataceae bacterium]
MSESELGKALLQVDASSLAGMPSSQQMTWKILEHDRRHVRRLTILTMIIWVMAAGMVGLVLIGFGLLMPLEAKIREGAETGKLAGKDREALEQVAHKSSHMLTLAIAGSVGILALAALTTVRLIFAARQATLRQVNASLVEISQQLKELRATLAKPAPAPPPAS